jgi:hypothetical protein
LLVTNIENKQNEQQGLEFLVVYQSEVNLPWVPLCTKQLHKALFGFVLLYPSDFKKEYETCHSSAHFKAESEHHLISHSERECCIVIEIIQTTVQHNTYSLPQIQQQTSVINIAGHKVEIKKKSDRFIK